MEEFALARIAEPRRAPVMRKGERVPMLRAAHECAIFGPNVHGLIPSPDRRTRIDGAERAHGDSAVVNATIAVAL
jgi:hypothetical protein